MNIERYQSKLGIAMLDSHIETLGEVGLLSLIVEKLSVGTKPSEIARSLEVPFLVMWEWLEADPKRQRAYDQGWAMYANDLHADTIRIADEASIEEVPLARLRTDVRFKAASNYDRKRFGAQQQQTAQGFAGGVTIVIGDVVPQGGVPQVTVSENTVQIAPQKKERVVLEAEDV